MILPQGGTVKMAGWDQVQRYYADFGTGPWMARFAPVLRIAAWLKEEGYTAELHGMACRAGLIISDRAEFPWGEHMIRVDSQPTPGFMEIEYCRAPGDQRNMRKQVTEDEAPECLRQFLAYYFGVHRPKKKDPNQAPDPTAPSGRGSS
jgi:hypothetical protein